MCSFGPWAAAGSGTVPPEELGEVAPDEVLREKVRRLNQDARSRPAAELP
ncbi:hypothetical protein [Streptomyces sp. NPDC001410]